MRAIFADSACRNVCESPIIQDLASGLQVALKEKSRTISVHHGATPFVFSLDPLEVMNF